MVRRCLVSAVFLAFCLACSGDWVQGVKAGAEQGFDKKFRSTFVTACTQQSAGNLDPDLQRRVCSCVADELVNSKTPAELADLITSPTVPEVQPILEACARKLVH